MTPVIIRPSSLPRWSDCERRIAAQLFPREVLAAGHPLRSVPRGIGAIIGTAVHYGIEVMLAGKVATGRLPFEGDCQDAARTKLREQTDSGEVLYEGPRGATHRIGDAIDQTTRMTLAYQLGVAPRLEPIAIVEKRLEAEVEPGIILSGQPDLVCREPGALRDVKTGMAMPASYDAQLGAYSMLARTHGLDIERGSIDFIQRVRRHAHQPAPVTKTTNLAHAETAAANIIKRIASALETFRLGDRRRNIAAGDPWAFLANPSSNLCSPKYCPAWGTGFCHEGRQQKE